MNAFFNIDIEFWYCPLNFNFILLYSCKVPFYSRRKLKAALDRWLFCHLQYRNKAQKSHEEWSKIFPYHMKVLMYFYFLKKYEIHILVNDTFDWSNSSTLHKICKNTGFHWPVFSRTFSSIVDSVLIRENTGQWTTVFSHILCSADISVMFWWDIVFHWVTRSRMSLLIWHPLLYWRI